MTINQRTIDWMRLSRSENVGPLTFFNLLNRFGSADVALEAVQDLARNAGGRKIKLISRAEIDRELTAIAQLGGKILCAIDDDYPPLLKHCPDAPPVLVALGNLHLVHKSSVAIVGGRSSSLPARKLANHLAATLGQAGQVIVSGLALGIDTAAHAGALNSGTIAVIAGGINQPYPPQNSELHWRIAEAGLILSEDWINAPHTARKFPKRNRIIAGVTAGTIVIEAKERSGTLITARLANEYGREVFAVPGFPGDARNRGGNQLIRNGATLIETAADVLAELESPLGPAGLIRRERSDSGLEQPPGYRPSAPAIYDQIEIDRLRGEIESLLAATAVSVDELIGQCQAPAHLVLASIAELELAGRLERQPGGTVSRSF